MSPLNRWVHPDPRHATYAMAEDLCGVGVSAEADGRWELDTPDGSLRFGSRDSAMSAADTYIKDRREAWQKKWLYQGGRDITPIGEWFVSSGMYYKSGTGYMISIYGSKVMVCDGVHWNETTYSIQGAIKAVNDGEYPVPADPKPYVVNPAEAHSSKGPLEYTVKRPTHLAVGQVWRVRGGNEAMVTHINKGDRFWFDMTISDNLAILNYGGTEYVGKVPIG